MLSVMCITHVMMQAARAVLWHNSTVLAASGERTFLSAVWIILYKWSLTTALVERFRCSPRYDLPPGFVAIVALCQY